VWNWSAQAVTHLDFCRDWDHPESPSCQTYGPGFVAFQTRFGTDSTTFVDKLFHELGHTVGLYDVVADSNGNARVRPPNHVSAMNYQFLHGIDELGHLDYSSGLRPSLQQSALREDLGIGSYFGASGNNYFSNKPWTLGKMGCLRNSVGYNTGRGPAPVTSAESYYPANIDWNKNGTLETTPVSGYLWDSGVNPVCSPGTLTAAIPDVAEWGVAASTLSSGARGMRSISAPQYGTMICSAAEGISCPTGYYCNKGWCIMGTPMVINRESQTDDFVAW
jgi:hypothetical protein